LETFPIHQPGCGFSRRDNCIRSNGGRKCAAAFRNGSGAYNLASRLNQDVGVFRVEK